MPDELFTDAVLLSQYRDDGNEAAFSALVDRYQAMVLGVAFRHSGSAELASEVTQHVFAELARQACFLGSRASVAGWLHQAAVHEATRATQTAVHQHGNGNGNGNGANDDADPADSAADFHRWTELEQAIDAMATPDREVLVLHYLQDLSHAEIAAHLGIPEPAVRTLTSEALGRLGKELRKRGIGGEVTALLMGALALQASLTPSTGLAQAALAAAATGSSSGAFLTLTAVHGSSAIKTTAAILAAAALPAWWYIHERAESTAAPGMAPLTSATTVLQPAVERSTTATAAGAGASDQLSAPPALASSPALPAGPAVKSARLIQPAPRISSANAPRAATINASNPQAKPPTATTVNAGTTAVPSTHQGSTPSGSELTMSTTAAVRDTLQQLELLPEDAAQLYSRLLEDVLALTSSERQHVDALLRSYFEQLNLAGLAGAQPELPSIDWYAARKALRDGLTAVIDDAPRIAEISDVLEPLLSVPELPPVDGISEGDTELQETVLELAPTLLSAVASDEALGGILNLAPKSSIEMSGGSLQILPGTTALLPKLGSR
jgi:RNA polymerase sigma factor (sigma-70 family)